MEGQYKEHGIETEVKILAGYSPDMNAMDLWNCTEIFWTMPWSPACGAKGRDISVKMWKEANFWILRIENSAPNEHPKRYNFLTLKEDKGIHGVGLKVVRDIIQKYDGAFHTEDKEKGSWCWQ